MNKRNNIFGFGDDSIISILKFNANHIDEVEEDDSTMIKEFEQNKPAATIAALEYLKNYIKDASYYCSLKSIMPEEIIKEVWNNMCGSSWDIIYGIVSSTDLYFENVCDNSKPNYEDKRLVLDLLSKFIEDNIDEVSIIKYFDNDCKLIPTVTFNIILTLLDFIKDGGECTDEEMISASIKAVKALIRQHISNGIDKLKSVKELQKNVNDTFSEKIKQDMQTELRRVEHVLIDRLLESLEGNTTDEKNNKEDESPIRIIKPSVKVLKTSFDDTDVARSIEKVARTCYKSEDKMTDSSAEKMVKGLLKSEHMAMFEHETITVLFRCDRGVSHEIVRHRLASYAQESTRYCNYSNGKFDHKIEVIDPTFGFEEMAGEPSYRKWKEAMENAANSYFELIDLGMAPQMARDVLPTSVATSIVVTMNLREWRHFIKLRCLGTTGAPHPQMKYLASKLLEEFGQYYPIIFGDLLEEYKNSNK